MRIFYAVPLLVLAACQAEVDQQNDAVTLQYDQNVAENTAATVANEAREIGGHIANDVSDAAAAVDNRIEVNGVEVGNDAR